MKNKNASYANPGTLDHQMTLYRFPRMLVLHLKRETGQLEKNTTPIFAPYKLDMKPFGPHSTHQSKENAHYSLQAIVHHSNTLSTKTKSGPRASEFGHYFCEVKRNQQWYFCDDSVVSAK